MYPGVRVNAPDLGLTRVKPRLAVSGLSFRVCHRVSAAATVNELTIFQGRHRGILRMKKSPRERANGRGAERGYFERRSSMPFKKSTRAAFQARKVALLHSTFPVVK